MTWRETTLGAGIHIKHGYAFKSEFFVNSGKYIVLTPGNFYEEGGFRLRAEKDRAYSGSIPENFILSKGDIIIAMTEQDAGLLGSSALIPENDRFLHNQRLGLIDKIDEELFNKNFLYYLFNTYSIRGQISGSASGTKVRHTSPDKIYRVKIKIPDVTTQQKIADILSKYDDLIENNRRRIELLERSARLLYKEWFVRLRFPGHEHTPIIDGIPEGWERLKLGEVLTLQRGFDLPSAKRTHGQYPIFASTGINGYHEKAKVQAPGIVTGRSGSLGKVMYIAEDFWPLNTTLYVKDFIKVDAVFALHLLENLHLEQYNSGAAVPTLNRNDIHKIKVLCPSCTLKSLFLAFANPIYTQIHFLDRYNQKLKQARDILLPKLMNGEIEV
jgi:type I restriction enzyme S subunit